MANSYNRDKRRISLVNWMDFEHWRNHTNWLQFNEVSEVFFFIIIKSLLPIKDFLIGVKAAFMRMFPLS